MAIPHGQFVSVPLVLYFFLLLDLVYFMVAALRAYFGGFQEVWGRMCSTKVGRMQLWLYSMTHGVGLGVVAYMLLEIALRMRISRIEAEVLFVAHGAWVGVHLAFLAPPGPALRRGLCHPHVLMLLALCATAWDLPRRGCLALTGLLAAFGLRRHLEYRRAVLGGWAPELHEAAEAELAAGAARAGA